MLRSDPELLASFARSRDEQAFEELVTRHLGLVLGAARRRLPGRGELAEEVAQNVFVTLARKASKLRTHPCLPAWLQKTASFEAMRAARKETNYAKKMKRLESEMSVAPPPQTQATHAWIPRCRCWTKRWLPWRMGIGGP